METMQDYLINSYNKEQETFVLSRDRTYIFFSLRSFPRFGGSLLIVFPKAASFCLDFLVLGGISQETIIFPANPNLPIGRVCGPEKVGRH